MALVSSGVLRFTLSAPLRPHAAVLVGVDVVAAVQAELSRPP